MKAEVEKVITMSLTKMAESRGLRRGGTSLHKHLLISSVLTKARSAYMDAWRTVSSAQEIESSTPAHSRPSGAPQLICSSDEPLTEEDQAALLDSRSLFTLDGTEMDLPSDILNCVEKMSGIPDDVGFNLRDNISASSVQDESDDERRTTAELILAEFVEGLSSADSASQKSYTYLDLDSSSNSTGAVVSNLDDISQLNYSPANCKRRREWTFDDAEDSDEEDEGSGDVFSAPFLGTKRFRFALSENYSFRATCDSPENIIPAGTSMLMSISTASATNYNSSVNRTPLEPFFTFKGNNFNFRTKKSQFDEFEEEESREDDVGPFVYQDDDADDYEGNVMTKKEKNDRRVPSSNGSCSSSDEEHEQDTAMDMDLDKITNLVQYISFTKGGNVDGSGSTTTGMVRSISTPDLFSYAAKQRSADSMDLPDKNTSPAQSQTNTKDLYSSCFNSYTSPYHRVLTMRV